jgi:predicted membrane metal-binding protein
MNSMAVVAAVISIFNPNLLWDVGFQFYFMTALGLALHAMLSPEWGSC